MSVGGFGLGLAPAAKADSAPDGVNAPPPGQVVDRTAFTTTTESASGQMTTRTYPDPVNFQTDSGAWKPVDDTLEHASDGTVHPADVDGDASIPSSLSRPLELQHDGRTLSFRLHGASGDPSGDRAVNGTQANFDDAIPGVTVTYAARSQGLKETLALDSASAPHAFTYDLTADDDLTASVDAGGDVVLTDGAGATQFRISAPLAWDSAPQPQLSDALVLSVTKQSAGHWLLGMHADDAWLSDPARVYPVSLDPNISWIDPTTERIQGDTQDCYLYGGNSANTSTCDFYAMAMGYLTRPARPVMQFDVSSIPSDAIVSGSQLSLWLPSAYASTSSITSRVHTITSAWTNDATWNNRNAAATWSTAGGDMSSDPALTGTAMTTVGAGNQWYHWNVPAETVHRWVAGTLANNGLELSSNTEASGTGQFLFNTSENSASTWPALDVTWTLPNTVGLALSGPAITGAASWQTSASTSVTLAATDTHSGVTRLEVDEGTTVLGSATQTCAAGACSFTHAFSLDLTALPDGIHNLTAVAKSANGQSKSTPFTVKNDQTAPALALTGTLVDNQSQTAASGTRSVAVHASDTGAGVTLATLSIDGVEKNRATQACTAGGCALDATWSVDLATLTNGPHDVTIVATDGAGHTTTRHLTITTDLYAMPTVPALSTTTETPYIDQVSFLWTGAHPLQTGVAAGTINARQSAVIEGKVFNGTGDPAAGVTVTIADHPEYGQTLTRDDGSYWLGVNGGGQMRVHYAVQGALPSDRDVDVKWNDYTAAPDVWLVTADSKGTNVTFGASATTDQIAAATPVSDSDGTRTTRVLVEPNTTAWAVASDGTKTVLPSGTMRVTEYTVGAHGEERMPASLPDSTSYTWAAEYQIDQASGPAIKHVEFSKPVVSYTDNFLHFPVGTDIPVGTYEPSLGDWKGNPDGRVIKILSITAGKAVVDVTGFGAANQQELDHYNIDDAELTQLGSTYHAGDTLWRTQLSHFSRYDLNRKLKNKNNKKGRKTSHRDKDKQCNKTGSIIGCQNQSLGEVADLGGTPYSLRYDSTRTPGAVDARSLTVALTDATLPDDLAEVRAQVVIAGQRLSYTDTTPQPNDFHVFRWDGKDQWNRVMVGGATADVEVANEYPSPYSQMARGIGNPDDYEWVTTPYLADGPSVTWGYSTRAPSTLDRVTTSLKPPSAPADRPPLTCNDDASQCWYEVSNPPTMPLGRDDAEVASEYSVAVPYVDARSMGVGGWSISDLHHYDVATGTLFTGDGQRESAAEQPGIVTTLAGPTSPGVHYLSGESIAVLADGSVLGVDFYNGRVLRTAPDAAHTTSVYATGFHSPKAIAVGPDQSVYVADYAGGANSTGQIDKVFPDGSWTPIAGTGTFSDGAKPTVPLQRRLFNPQSLAVAPDGTLYIGDQAGLLRLDPSGTITRFAGFSSFGCGHPGSECAFASVPASVVAVGPDGTIYWDGSGGGMGNALYRFSPGDVAPTLVESNFTYDTVKAGPLSESGIVASSMTFDTGGHLILADSRDGQQSIWRLTDDSRVTQIGLADCDTKQPGDPDGHYNGEGGPVTQACGSPVSITAGPDGLYTLDGNSAPQIRKIAPGLGRYPGGAIEIGSPDGSEAYEFDSTGRQTATRDGTTGRVTRTFTYDTPGRITAITETDYGTTQFYYPGNTDGINTEGHAAVILGPDGQRTTIDTDANGWATNITDASGAAQSFLYAPSGLMAYRSNELGHTSTFNYNAGGRLISDTSPLGRGQTLSRTETADATSVSHVDKTGATTTYGSTTSDNDTTTTTVSSPDGTSASGTENATTGSQTLLSADGTATNSSPTTAFTGGAQTQFVGEDTPSTATTVLPSGLSATASHNRQITRASTDSASDPFAFRTLVDTYNLAGNTTTDTYDKAAKTDTITTPLGRTATTTFDSHDNPIKVSTPGRNDTTIDYDPRDRPVAVHQNNHVATTRYDSHGRVDQTVDELGHTTAIARDLLGQPTTVTDPAGAATGFAYDAAGQTTQITAPDNRLFQFGYDADGDTTSTSRGARPSSGLPPLVTGATYDTGGRLTKITRPSGKTLTMAYDSADRVTSATANDGTATTLSYESVAPAPATPGSGDTGAAGRLHRIVTDRGVTSTFGYDGSLPTRFETSGDADTGDGGSDHTQVDTHYDNSLRVDQIKVAGTDPENLGYNADGDLTSAGQEALAYNPTTGDPVSTTTGAVQSHLTIDGQGDLAAQSWTADQTGAPNAPVLAETLTRNALGEITSRHETTDAGTSIYEYTYDADGRLLTVKRDAALTETYSYDISGGLTSRGNGTLTTSFATDGYGRPTASTDGTAATWTTDGELASLTRPGTSTEQFTYDGLGRLTHVVLPNGDTGDYRYDGLGHRVSVRLNGQISRRFVYAGGLFPLARVDAAGSVIERYEYGTQPQVPDVIVRRDGTKLRLITDSLGSVRAVVDTSSGQVVQRLNYDAYGRITQDTNPGLQPFGFKGSISDPVATAAGLDWMGVRAYSPTLARFTTPDPEGIDAAWNEHDALAGDPINLVDTDGLLSRQTIVNASAGLGDGILGAFGVAGCGLTAFQACSASDGWHVGSAARNAVGNALFGGAPYVDVCGTGYRTGRALGAAVTAVAGAAAAGAAISRVGLRNLLARLSDERGSIRVTKNGEDVFPPKGPKTATFDHDRPEVVKRATQQAEDVKSAMNGKGSKGAMVVRIIKGLVGAGHDG